jgi:hypothetical protein
MGVTLSKDNLARHNWKESKQFAFCAEEETILHLFFIVIMLDFFCRAIYLFRSADYQVSIICLMVGYKVLLPKSKN